MPDTTQTPAIGECLNQTARLVQTAFKANGFDVTVVGRGPARRGQARDLPGGHGFGGAQAWIVVTNLGLELRAEVVGRDVIIAGRDQPRRAKTENPAAADLGPRGHGEGRGGFSAAFMRHAVSVSRPARRTIREGGRGGGSAGVAGHRVSADRRRSRCPRPGCAARRRCCGSTRRTRRARVSTTWRTTVSRWWTRSSAATPRSGPCRAEMFAETHPEYFALIGGKRAGAEEGTAQYCISNPEVQERIYQDLIRGSTAATTRSISASRMASGHASARTARSSSAPATDWSEKLWILHRKLADACWRPHPGKQVTMMSYILTASPPKTFKAFPHNTRIMLTGTNEEDIAPWRDCDVPGGFTGLPLQLVPESRHPLHADAHARLRRSRR